MEGGVLLASLVVLGWRFWNGSGKEELKIMVGEDVAVLVDDATVSVDAVETTVDATDAAMDKPERGRKRVVAIIAAVCVVVLVAAGLRGRGMS